MLLRPQQELTMVDLLVCTNHRMGDMYYNQTRFKIVLLVNRSGKVRHAQGQRLNSIRSKTTILDITGTHSYMLHVSKHVSYVHN